MPTDLDPHPADAVAGPAGTAATRHEGTGRLWDVFCRVVDNHGDLGVCWRLACDLASRGERVRLWIDQPAALSWMAPGGHAGVQTVPWQEGTPAPEPGEVVIEAFGCDPPPAFVARMQRTRPPIWINLEYLSAETWIERSHGLRSPQSTGPARGLDKWFFFPGFSERSGGLLREPGLAARRAAFDAGAWLARHGVPDVPGERRISLFCYSQPRIPAWLDRLAADGRPTRLLTTPGPATEQVRAAWERQHSRGTLTLHPLPWLPQPAYDELLWACDLNFVRGEDSFVRAQWAGQPFVWQIYPQSDGAHAIKLEAFLDRHLAGVSEPLAQALRGCWRAWNGLDGGTGWPAEPAGEAWSAACDRWTQGLRSQPDLTTRLLGFVADKG